MSLVPVTVTIERDTETDDGYGGVTAVSADLYTGLSGYLNFKTAGRTQRSESTGQGGPGVETLYRGLLKFEPIPASTTIRINDRVYVPVTGERWKVVGVRAYEYTLQLDIERLV